MSVVVRDNALGVDPGGLVAAHGGEHCRGRLGQVYGPAAAVVDLAMVGVGTQRWVRGVRDDARVRLTQHLRADHRTGGNVRQGSAWAVGRRRPGKARSFPHANDEQPLAVLGDSVISGLENSPVHRVVEPRLLVDLVTQQISQGPFPAEHPDDQLESRSCLTLGQAGHVLQHKGSR